MIGREKLARKDLAKLLGRQIDTVVLETAYDEANKKFASLGGDDDVARGGALIQWLRTNFPRLLKSLAKNKSKVRAVKKK